MMIRFHNYEAAALHVAQMRSEGHLAWVCDPQSSLLYGPMASGGCRVFQSETPIEIPEGEPELDDLAAFPDRQWFWILRISALALATLPVIFVGTGLVSLAWGMPGRLVMLSVEMVVIGLLLVILGLVAGMAGRFLGLNSLIISRWRLWLIWPLVLILILALGMAPP